VGLRQQQRRQRCSRDGPNEPRVAVDQRVATEQRRQLHTAPSHAPDCSATIATLRTPHFRSRRTASIRIHPRWRRDSSSVGRCGWFLSFPFPPFSFGFSFSPLLIRSAVEVGAMRCLSVPGGVGRGVGDECCDAVTSFLCADSSLSPSVRPSALARVCPEPPQSVSQSPFSATSTLEQSIICTHNSDSSSHVLQRHGQRSE